VHDNHCEGQGGKAATASVFYSSGSRKHHRFSSKSGQADLRLRRVTRTGDRFEGEVLGNHVRKQVRDNRSFNAGAEKDEE
jgi:hypothetical protein